MLLEFISDILTIVISYRNIDDHLEEKGILVQ